MERIRDEINKLWHELKAEEPETMLEFSGKIPEVNADTIVCISRTRDVLDPTQTIWEQKYTPNIGFEFGNIYKAKRNGLTLVRFSTWTGVKLFTGRNSPTEIQVERLKALASGEIWLTSLGITNPGLQLDFIGLIEEDQAKLEELREEARRRGFMP